jgi:hypothetical protein
MCAKSSTTIFTTDAFSGVVPFLCGFLYFAAQALSKMASMWFRKHQLANCPCTTGNVY